MAMLAEPRRKQKVINLRAKNSAWSNDSNKFGQRMLEKMGWSAGKGLGAKENGIVEHVIAKYKNDDKGLGYEDKNDQWTKHEDDFNALLANLSSDKDEKKEVLHSGVSLEVKSKKSKARIHYHKFTRGKDLSRYSEKDLANIFGKKSLKEERCVEDVVDKEEFKSTEKVFTEKGSMEDYFKCKMAAIKMKNKSSHAHTHESDNGPDYVFQGFSTINEGENVVEKKETFSFYNNSKNNSEEIIIQEVIEEKSSKKSKKKKNKKEADKNSDKPTDFSFQQFSYGYDNTEINAQETSPCSALKEDAVNDTVFLSKKSKKKKNKGDESQCEIKDVIIVNDTNKKSSKKKNAEVIENSEQISEQNSIEYVPKKKKKKNKDL